MAGRRAQDCSQMMAWRRRGRPPPVDERSPRITLAGGPMDGKTVTLDSRILRDDWYLSWPRAISAVHLPGRYVAAGPSRARWEPL